MANGSLGDDFEMVRIAYILLCHKNPDEVVAMARQLAAGGDCVTIHFDSRAPRRAFRALRDALSECPSVAFTDRRVRCGWGEWSLVEATLLGLKAALRHFPDATHFYMLSGDCRPIKTADHAHRILSEVDADHIESHDFFESDWIRTGLREDRLAYRHYFNERSQKRLFYASLRLQRALHLRRTPPPGLRIMIGSQWWCLRRSTVEAVLAFCRTRRDVMRFFRTTWIPDETFFQTLVPHLVPREQIRCRSLTFLMFSDYGMPVTFHNDHHDFLLAQDALFARKISPGAVELKSRLGALYAQQGLEFPDAPDGRNQIRFLAGCGREGRRFARRFWESEGCPDQERELLLVVCKKWHVAKRLVDSLRRQADLPALHYLFDEDAADLPDLGGLERGRTKRMRHRRVFVNLLFERFGSSRLLLCLDPAHTDMLEEFRRGHTRTRLLEIACDFDDSYLAGHARRVGLAGARIGRDALHQLLPSIRNDFAREADALASVGFPYHARLRQGGDAEENAVQLAGFLSISREAAREILAPDHLFAD